MKLYIVMGYLGSGKTTLIQNQNLKNCALIVNEFSDFGVDGEHFKQKRVFVEEISGGSIFCSCKSYQFLEALNSVAKRKPQTVIVECSGMANPSSMLQVLSLCKEKITLCGVICVVDALEFERMLSCVHMVKMQVAACDTAVINKSDLALPQTIERVKRAVQAINGDCEIVVTKNAEFDIFSVKRKERQLPQNTIDLITSKVEVTFDCYHDGILPFCEKLSQTAHRIKGAVKKGEGWFLYEYANGRETFAPATARESSFLVLLAVGNAQLLQQVQGNLLEGMKIV